MNGSPIILNHMPIIVELDEEDLIFRQSVGGNDERVVIDSTQWVAIKSAVDKALAAEKE